MRDDFSRNTKIALAMKAGLTCSNPGCRVYTGGPDQNIGVAAHIRAASSGGPRFDSSLSPEERRSEANGIWLCQGCAKRVDSPAFVQQFSVGLLELWKQIAETRASAYVGKTSPFLADLQPASSEHGNLLGLSSARDAYQLYDAVSGQPCTFSTTSTAREQVAAHESISTVLNWATEIIVTSWDSGDPELLGICATLLSTLTDQWHPDARTLDKLEAICSDGVAAGRDTHIPAIEPLLFAVAAKGRQQSYTDFLAARVRDEDYRQAEAARSSIYYGADGQTAAAVFRHLHDPRREGLLRANDLGRLLSLVTKPAVDLSRRNVRALLLELLRDSIRELREAGEPDLAAQAVKFLKSNGLDLEPG